MIQDRDILITEDKTIRHALVQLSGTRKKHLICVGEGDRFLGLINDGDIRRSLIEHGDLDLPVGRIMNTAPLMVNEQTSEEEVQRLLSVRMGLIPVVDKNKRFVGYHLLQDDTRIDPIKNRSIAILGMGYVGLTLGVVLADRGFRVYGYDIDQGLVDRLGRAEPPFYEKGLERHLHQHVGRNLKFTTELETKRADIYIITVGTPLMNGGKEPNIDYLRAALRSIGRVLQSGNLVVLRSTVPLGTTRSVALPILEEESGLVCGRDFLLSFAPERTAEGVALKELTRNPQIIGSHNPAAYHHTALLFNQLTSTVIDMGSLEAAELAKLMDNTFRDHIFAYANNMAMLADSVGLDIHQIIDAVNLGYSRNTIPKPSPGVGGACLSKDPYILQTAFEQAGVDSRLVLCSREINELGPQLVYDKLCALLAQAGKSPETCTKIALIGMAFKGDPETSDLRDSTSVWFLDKLPRKDNVCAYDPVVADADLAGLGIAPVGLEEAFDQADAVVILNNHVSYGTWDLPALLARMNTPAAFIDTWNTFRPVFLKRHPGILYGGLGNG